MAALGLMALLGFCRLGVYAVTALVQWVLGWPIKPAAVLEAIAFKIAGPWRASSCGSRAGGGGERRR